jgi:hyaluronan synthase
VAPTPVAPVIPIRPGGSPRPVTPEIRFRPRRGLIIFPLLLIAGVSGVLHARLIAGHHVPVAAAVVWALAFSAVTIQIVLAWVGRPYTADPPAGLKVTVVVPCYNEDPAYLMRVLDSLRVQTRKPDRVIVCDDGSKVSYDGIPGSYPEVEWIRQDNAGKKHAQAACVRADPDADIYVMIDSDSALERRALEQGLRPFADRRVMAAAGVEWAGNYSHNLLTRSMGARSLAFQLFAMSSQSTARGSVLIAPGAFSLYRGWVIRECLPAYLGETFCGVPVVLGDDTMLTFFALMRGRVVQQMSAVAFPAYPEKISHHLRQWTRWMRASTIRQIWRLRYLPISSYGWWFSVWQLGAYTAGLAASALTIAAWPASAPLLAGSMTGLFVWPLILACRLACMSRSDQSAWSLLGGVALMPFAGLWYLLVLRQIRLYGIATCTRQGWVTRAKVEVRLHDASQAPG